MENQIANEHTEFWLALLDLNEDAGHRIRLWNGYLGWKLPSKTKGKINPKGGWPQLIVDPPDGGWPKLTEDEREQLEALVKTHGGHPDFNHEYMNFSGHIFSQDVDLSGLILVNCRFDNARFKGHLKLSEKTHFYAQAWFQDTTFEKGLDCYETLFHAPVSFDRSIFNWLSNFMGVEFMGGASFDNTEFKWNVLFNDSKFEVKYFSRNFSPIALVSFRKTKFLDGASFRNVLFGNNSDDHSRNIEPERIADFTDAEFGAATTFRRAIFAGVPAFFNSSLHEDTDFGRVDWGKAETDNISAEYAIRAWERLELMMSKLEKPLDQHRFFRLKMRARRRTDDYFLRVLNWLFEKTADYGWGTGRAFSWWLGHWFVSGLALFTNTGSAVFTTEWWKLALAALGNGFANAHAFLFLSTKGGFLAPSRALLENNDELGMLVAIGTVEAVLGPIFLFLLLLTLRNRFRLA